MMPAGIHFLDLEDLLALTRRLGVGPVTDVGLLEAACARPRTRVMGADAYSTLIDKAAALLHSMVRNHALADGDNRLGWLATVVFLDLNGGAVEMPDDAAVSLVMRGANETYGLMDIVVALQSVVRFEEN